LNPRHVNDFLERKNPMSFKYTVFAVALSVALAGCGSEVPKVNSTNCSGIGMQAVLPTFETDWKCVRRQMA
jgi:entry exclusion lipoprotein TrbK